MVGMQERKKFLEDFTTITKVNYMEFRLGRKIKLDENFVTKLQDPPTTNVFIITAIVDEAVSLKSIENERMYTLRMADVTQFYSGAVTRPLYSNITQPIIDDEEEIAEEKETIEEQTHFIPLTSDSGK